MSDKLVWTVSIRQEEDGSYWGEVKELPGCLASGRTPQELFAALAEATEMWQSEPAQPEEEETRSYGPGEIDEAYRRAEAQ